MKAFSERWFEIFFSDHQWARRLLWFKVDHWSTRELLFRNFANVPIFDQPCGLCRGNPIREEYPVKKRK